MARRADPELPHPTWRAAAGALAEAGRPMSAAEIARATGRDSSNAKGTAEAMVRAGLLSRVTPAPRSGRGRRPTADYTLTAKGRIAGSSQAPRAGDRVTGIGPGQQLLFAEATPERLPVLWRTFARLGAQAARPRWYALIDGDRQEYVLAFEGDAAAERVIDLMAALAEAEVRCRRASVASAGAGGDLARTANRQAG